MRIVELELEVASKRQECEDNARDYHASLQKQKEITEEQNTVWMKQVNQLTAEIEEVNTVVYSIVGSTSYSGFIGINLSNDSDGYLHIDQKIFLIVFRRKDALSLKKISMMFWKRKHSTLNHS